MAAARTGAKLGDLKLLAKGTLASLVRANPAGALSCLFVIAHESCNGQIWSKVLLRAVPDAEGVAVVPIARPESFPDGQVAVLLCSAKKTQLVRYNPLSGAFAVLVTSLSDEDLARMIGP